MNTTLPKATRFTHLIAWQKGHQLVLGIYKMTSLLPPEERYGLSVHIQRAAVSITSNIAEGFIEYQRRKRFSFIIALGSVTELQNQLLIVRDLKLVANEIFQALAEQTKDVARLLNALIRSLKVV